SYLLTLPMLTQMPRWPSGKILQVFDGAQLSGPSRLFGAESGLIEGQTHTPIQVTRAEVLDGQLPERILAALDEPQTRWLLGAEPARVV
ncbi:hypothetical protein, partial [Mesorhizobium japonicum]